MHTLRCRFLPAFTRGLRFETGFKKIPHARKARTGGEDAVLCLGSCLAVADGVGGWSQMGVDAGKYSRELVGHLQQALPGREHDPVAVMTLAANATEATGSSTCCVVTLVGDALHGANLGDSGFVLYRPGAGVLHKTEEQQLAFNTPRQLGTGSSDVPAMADVSRHVVEVGDLVFVATDGVFDNLYDDQLAALLKLAAGGPVEDAAELVAQQAHMLSLSNLYMSPFAMKEVEAAAAPKPGRPMGSRGRVRQGGKPDDISVVLGRVVA